MADFEEELDAFVVRKEIADTELSETQRKTVVPLLLCDILGAKTANGDLFSVFDGKLKFKLCLLSGRIVGLVCSNTCCETYLIDDGTACVELGIFKNDKAKVTRTCHRLTFYYKPELVGPLRRILYSAKIANRLLDATNVKIGTAMLVLGRVSLFRGKIHVVGLKLFGQEGANCDMEIAFKDYLILCYRDR